MKPKVLEGIQPADAFVARLFGLMGRKSWPQAHRGLFFPRCRAVHTFFTFLKPDLVFVDKNKKILRIFPSASPGRVFWGSWECRHCLELPEGTVPELDLEIGDRVWFEGKSLQGEMNGF
jgi:uncharacterized protein